MQPAEEKANRLGLQFVKIALLAQHGNCGSRLDEDNMV
jgi:hypothetical protein